MQKDIDVDEVMVYHPDYVGKQPVLETWLAAYEAQTYARRSLFVIDNTTVRVAPRHEYLKVLQDHGVPSIHIEPWLDKPLEHTLHRCWELAAEEARRRGAFWVWSLEADNICGPKALEVMHTMAVYGNCHLVTHDYPLHEEAARASGIAPGSKWYREFGCMLLSLQLLERALAEYDEYGCMSRAVFRTNDRYRGGHVILTHSFQCDHLDTWETEFPMYPDPPEGGPIVNPYTAIPEESGSVLPDCLKHLEKEMTDAPVR